MTFVDSLYCFFPNHGILRAFCSGSCVLGVELGTGLLMLSLVLALTFLLRLWLTLSMQACEVGLHDDESVSLQIPLG